jgi:hypothetical protein
LYCAQKLLIVYAGTQTGDFTVTVVAICPASSCTSSQSHSVQIDLSIFASGGGGGGGSVAAGTMITLANGQQIPVEQLHAGMQLLSYDVTSHSYVITTITKFTTVTVFNEMTIKTSNGRTLVTDQNPAQKLYVKLAGGSVVLMPVTELKVGYHVFDALNQKWVTIKSIDYVNSGTYTMYDIYPTAPGNYIANGILDPYKN